MDAAVVGIVLRRRSGCAVFVLVNSRFDSKPFGLASAFLALVDRAPVSKMASEELENLMK